MAMKENMEIEVLGDMPFTELESLFSSIFPFLVIEIYQSGEPLNGLYKAKKLSQIGRKKESIAFRIVPEMSVNQLEKLFWENFGIQMSVFRKVGSSLLETTFTSAWTLQHQNQKGVQILNDFNLANQSS